MCKSRHHVKRSNIKVALRLCMCDQLAQCPNMKVERRELSPRPLDRTSNVISITLSRHTIISRTMLINYYVYASECVNVNFSSH